MEECVGPVIKETFEQWVRYFDEQGVALQSLHEAIDTSTATGKLTFHLFGALAEFERNLMGISKPTLYSYVRESQKAVG